MEDTNWALPGGTQPALGIVGHVVCVGYGPLGRYSGMSMDQVLSFEFVDSNATIQIASPSENSDVFYAFRGSCASSYGIITKVTLKLTKVPPKITYIESVIRYNKSSAIALFTKTFLFAAKNAPAELSGVVYDLRSDYIKIQANFIGSIYDIS